MSDVLTIQKRIRVYELDTNYNNFECSLTEFIDENDGFTDDELTNLNNLGLDEKMELGVHCGFVGIKRIK